MTGARSSLAAFLPDASATPEEITALGRKAWIERGIGFVVMKDIRDPWVRAAVRKEVERQLGLDRG